MSANGQAPKSLVTVSRAFAESYFARLETFVDKADAVCIEISAPDVCAFRARSVAEEVELMCSRTLR
jgi:hypothetical protein